jgi:hypothetical protein
LYRKFDQGGLYTAEELGLLTQALNDKGEPLFVEVEAEAPISEVVPEEVVSEEVVAEVVGLTEAVQDEVGSEEKAPRKLIVGKKKEG